MIYALNVKLIYLYSVHNIEVSASPAAILDDIPGVMISLLFFIFVKLWALLNRTAVKYF